MVGRGLHGAEPGPKAGFITRNSHGCAVWLFLHAIISSMWRSAFQNGLDFFRHAILPGPVREPNPSFVRGNRRPFWPESYHGKSHDD
jgi:hypothetical protein